MNAWRGWRSAAGLVFGYEAVALLTGKCPTITSYSSDRKKLKIALLVLTALHLGPPYVLAGARPTTPITNSK